MTIINPSSLPRPRSHPAADHGPAIDWARTRRLLVVRPDNMGDVVMTGPAVRALRAAAPRASVTLLASPAGAQVAPLVPGIDDLLVTSPTWQDAGAAGAPDPAGEEALVGRLRAGRYDAMVLLTSFSQSPWPAAYLGYLAGIPVRIGHSKEFGGTLLSHWVTPPPDDLHQIDRALHLLAAVGVPAQGRRTALALTEQARQDAKAARVAAALDAAYAVLSPGASCQARRYPAQRWGAAAGRLARAGLPVVVTGTARERALVDAVVDAAGTAAVSALTTLDVPGLAALVADAAVLLGNNSGPMHLADAVGTPIVSVFSGTDLPAQVAPRGAPTALLRQPTSCSPCRQFTCPYDLQCLDVDPADVADAALRLAATPTAEVTHADTEARCTL